MVCVDRAREKCYTKMKKRKKARCFMKTKKILAAVLALITLAGAVLTPIFFVKSSEAYGIAVAEYDKAKAHYDIAYAAYLMDKDTYLSEDRRALQQEDDDNVVYIDIRGYGILAVKLFPEVAPITVNNFKKLISEGFYDFLTFHRVINDFMIQAGCPNGDGTGGSGSKIKGEFSSNGVENKLSHTSGIISMARSNSFNSASSQFFIVEEDSTHLDGDYAAFGRVTIGMDIVHAIAEVATDDNDKPLEPIYIRRIVLDKAELATLDAPVAPEKPTYFSTFLLAYLTLAVALIALAGATVFFLLYSKEEKALKAARLAEIERNRRAAVAAARAKKKPKKK